MSKILVTGGAGYIGSVLVPLLLENGHQVRVLDSLMYGGAGLLPNFRHPRFEFQKGDLRDLETVKSAVKDREIIVHLAAIVGFPACRKNPQLAEEVNLGATKTLAEAAGKSRLVMFGSTGSNYGQVTDQMCTEETPLHPVSLYGKTKVAAESHLMEHCTTIAYRFATAFGLSPRPRLDLLVNDFVYQALKLRYLVVYESHFMRSFIHVFDIARSFRFGIENAGRMKGQVYNVGSESMNYSKADVCNKIKEKVEYYLHLAEVGEDQDKRNYMVSYQKIRSLGFDTSITLEQGIAELVQGLQVLEVPNPYSNV
jgi:nucleoside-diphosphate-sugar epimerase